MNAMEAMLRAGTVEQRFAQNMHDFHCWVCCQKVDFSSDVVATQVSWDRHSRYAHRFCFSMCLRYAQAVIDTQLAGQQWHGE